MTDTRKSTADMSRAELVAAMMRFNPFGGYCVKPCNHAGHTTEAYRKTVARIRGEESATMREP